MAPTTSDEFEGDDFSNNLFSDLAPLLTLFGEQVTKQFLSMSMGWADNILLAMGPLGIITTIVSAIRVGGGKRLKALVGRARESHSVAEQELLSSTSQNVCEMWSGQQIVRLIGNSEGMETLIITGDGEILDFKTSYDKRYFNRQASSLTSYRLVSYLAWWLKRTVEKVRGHVVLDSLEKLLGSISTKLSIWAQLPINARQRADRLANSWLGIAATVAPNLALNVHNATAPAWELRAWAFCGTLLQLFAIGFTGVATHHLKWTKAEDQATAYGYPCFCAGTVCLMLSIMVCGHVIEGVTNEFTLLLTDEARRNGVRILSFQRARVVGDQHFPSCAILMAEHNGVFRCSRLNNKNYRWLAAISTSMAISGYIVQFIGLRALHWSATLVQLGVTLIMTAIQAWVRRGLASDPAWCPLFEGHESATLALFTHSSRSSMSNKAKAQNRMKRLFAKMRNTTSNEIGQPLNEFILCYAIEPHRSGLIRGLDGFDEKLFTLPTALPLQVCLSFRKESQHDRNRGPLSIYERISKQIAPSHIDQEVGAVSDNLSNVIESVMNVLDPSKQFLLWKGDSAGVSLDLKGPAFLSWGFDICTSLLGDHERLAKQNLFFRLERLGSPTGSDWKLLDRNLVSGLLALSFHGLVTRLEHLNQVWGRRNLSVDQADLFNLRWDRNDIDKITHPFNSGRIVGHDTSETASQKMETLIGWLDIGQTYFNISRMSCKQYEPNFMDRGSDTEFSMDTSSPIQCFLGMFLSSASCSDDSSPGGDLKEELVIDTREDSSMVLQWAQELFSLFILAVASRTKRVLGDTREIRIRDGRPCFENSVFAKIADEAVAGGLAHDRAEAYTLIVPAFAHHDLLPTCSNEQAAESTSERPTSPAPAPSNSEENTP